MWMIGVSVITSRQNLPYMFAKPRTVLERSDDDFTIHTRNHLKPSAARATISVRTSHVSFAEINVSILARVNKGEVGVGRF